MRRWFFVLAAVSCGCTPPLAPGMVPVVRRPRADDVQLDEVARATPKEGARPLLVVHRREACSASAPVFLVDRRGTFYGAVGPGQAALITLPRDLARLEVLSSVDITAPLHSFSVGGDVAIPRLPAGVLITPRRVSARECWSTGQYVDARPAEKEELESILGDADFTWLEPRVADGQRFLERHHARLDEIFGGGVEQCGASPLHSPSYCPAGAAPLDTFVPPR